MPESVNGGNNSPAQPPKKEMSMEMRLLLAFLLMGAVMFVTQLWFKPQEPPPVQKRTEPSASAPKPGEPVPAVASPPATTAEVAPPAPVAGATQQQPQPAIIIDTDLFRVVLN